jgi:rhomboid protease GluP
MSINIFLIQLVGFACLFFLLRARQLPLGWVILSSGILLVLGSTYFVVADLAGWIAGSLWGIWIALPLALLAQIQRLVVQERYGRAYWLANCLRWLHPFDGLWDYPQLLRGLALAQQGQTEQATRIFDRYRLSKTQIAQTATALFYRQGARWPELLSWIKAAEKPLLEQSPVGLCYLRALGETGDLNGLLQAVSRIEQSGKYGHLALDGARLVAFAFCGQTAQVQSLLARALAIYPPDLRLYWLATAQLAESRLADRAASGQSHQQARQQLLDLQSRCTPSLKNAITWRLKHLTQPPGDLATLTAASCQILQQLEAAVQQENRYGKTLFGFAGQRARAVYLLIGLNLLAFGLELAWGGSQNLTTLYQLGALVPAAVWAGDWWRLLSANFLHAGILHLLVNLMGLYLFGSFVEATLGTRKFLLTYLGSGIGAMLVITLLGVLSNSNQISVGASGAIMGLCGTMGAFLLRGWQREGSKLAFKHLRFIGFVVGVQLLSDFLTPQVSIVGHFSGLILGFIIGLLLTR